MRKRATALIVRDNKVLLLRRNKPDREYYVFPGGGVEENETPEEALIREIKEELSLQVTDCQFLFSAEGIEVFKVAGYEGAMKISGPEKERMSLSNQYHPEWIEISKLKKMENVYPEVVAEKLLKL